MLLTGWSEWYYWRILAVSDIESVECCYWSILGVILTVWSEWYDHSILGVIDHDLIQ